MWEPVGPLAPSVYWRRRCVALGLALAVLGGLVWGLAGGSGGIGEPEPATVEARARAAAMTDASPADGPGPVEAALPPASPAPLLAPGDAPAPAPTPAPTPGAALFAPPGGEGFQGFLPPGVPTGSSGPLLATPTTTAPETIPTEAPPSTPLSTPPPSTPLPATSEISESTGAPAPGPCADDDLRVTARTDAQSYPAGRKPVLSLVVTNTGDAPCVRDLDAARQAVAVVRRPGDGLWGSNDCSPGDTDDVRTLRPGEDAVFSVRWSGRTSTPGCAGERTTVPPGTYQLLARLDGIMSEPVSFTLTG
ncbi:DUF4232 domain-containing protein [Actinomycetospora cinnamomea]|uniref:Uncharacterized protein DUF4232 n=1 Tax=Actinomycetospora cinnamomea TaxID=663609 RepID=A0A2U1FLN5_9PSEU|nr:DUF4232 domain-containing protein [Actinomycetospora cinnamomea]PVZ13032.1 uncharacterized protein DUF4232 [Actinomycetospora cinnamomea]